MKYRTLGQSGIRVSEVGFGGWAIGWGWGPVNDHDSLMALRVAFDRGVTLVDTSPNYAWGKSEALIGRACRESGQEIIVASKVGFVRSPRVTSFRYRYFTGALQDFSKGAILDSCEASLRSLDRECIDILQLHCPPLNIICADEPFETLELLQTQGKIRLYGVSVMTEEEALAAIERPGVSTVQILFNMVRQEPMKSVVPAAKGKGIGIIARGPLASGLLVGKFTEATHFPEDDHRSFILPQETFSGLDFTLGLEAVNQLKKLPACCSYTLGQVALRWILDCADISTTIPGAKTAAQVHQNVAASDLASLSMEDRLLITKIYEDLMAIERKTT